MPLESRLFTQPQSALLRWMCCPGKDLAPRISRNLLESLVAQPLTVLVAVLNGLLLNTAALLLHGGRIFAFFIVLDASMVVVRLLLFARIKRRASRGARTPVDLYLISSIIWCAIQGAMGFSAMRSNIASLQVICAMTIVGLVGPICMRNYGAPRYAFVLVSVTLGPLLCGAALSGNPWLLILGLQAPAFLVGSAQMLSRLRALTVSTLEAEQESYDRARRDPLTGLLNRTGLQEAIDAGGQMLRCGDVVFYLDLDGFKLINDLHGHQAGDVVLKSVADRLLGATKTCDIVARLGGDEFMIIVSGLNPRDGDRYAARLIDAITNEPYTIGSIDQLRVGVSIGFACSPEDGNASEELTQRADAALYEAKAAGKGIQRRYRQRERSVSGSFSSSPVEAAA